MSSTARGGQREASDYYMTPVKDIQQFLAAFVAVEGNVFEHHTILDPCAGGDAERPMSYPVALEDYKPGCVVTVDIREDSRALWKGQDWLQMPAPAFPPFAVISNPPFSLAMEFIEKALDEVQQGGYVIMLQRLNFLGSARRRPFFDRYMPKYVFVHHKRIRFHGASGSDSIEYAHFVWQRGHFSNFSTLFIV